MIILLDTVALPGLDADQRRQIKNTIINDWFYVSGALYPLTRASQAIIDGTGILAPIIKTTLGLDAAPAFVDDRICKIIIAIILCSASQDSCTIAYITAIVQAKRVPLATADSGIFAFGLAGRYFCAVEILSLPVPFSTVDGR
jgi:hypothetical protein